MPAPSPRTNARGLGRTQPVDRRQRALDRGAVGGGEAIQQRRQLAATLAQTAHACVVQRGRTLAAAVRLADPQVRRAPTRGPVVEGARGAVPDRRGVGFGQGSESLADRRPALGVEHRDELGRATVACGWLGGDHRGRTQGHTADQEGRGQPPPSLAAVEHRRERGDVGVTLRRIERQTPEQPVADPAGQPRSGGGIGAATLGREQGVAGVADEGRLAEQGRPCHHAQRVLIGPRVDGDAEVLLGRHVQRCAREGAGQRRAIGVAFGGGDVVVAKGR